MAEGDIVTSPTLALIGESLGANEAEAVIPFNRSQGILSGLQKAGIGTGASIVYSPIITVQVGDIASKSQVTQALSEYDSKLRQGLITAVVQARQGA
jgi:hypothetical protein